MAAPEERSASGSQDGAQGRKTKARDTKKPAIQTKTVREAKKAVIRNKAGVFLSPEGRSFLRSRIWGIPAARPGSPAAVLAFSASVFLPGPGERLGVTRRSGRAEDWGSARSTGRAPLAAIRRCDRTAP